MIMRPRSMQCLPGIGVRWPMRCALVLMVAGPWIDRPRSMGQELRRFEQVQRHMGVEFRITTYAPDSEAARAGMAAAFARIAALDQTLSDYRPDSELMRVCSNALPGQWHPVSDDLWRVLRQAQKVSRESGGRFDVTLGPLTRRWRQARRTGIVPTAEELAQLKSRCGYERMVVSDTEPQVRLNQAGMLLDLGGIGQGFAADEALAALNSHNLPISLVDASGDIAAGDRPPGADGWVIRIGLRDETSKGDEMLVLHNCGVSTTGDQFQFVESDGQRFSHVIDPRTGLGVQRESSVTVVARDATQADAWATAINVVEPDEGVALARRLGAISVRIDVRGGETRRAAFDEGQGTEGSEGPGGTGSPGGTNATQGAGRTGGTE